jgi:hypothetical protein
LNQEVGDRAAHVGRSRRSPGAGRACVSSIDRAILTRSGPTGRGRRRSRSSFEFEGAGDGAHCGRWIDRVVDPARGRRERAPGRRWRCRRRARGAILRIIPTWSSASPSTNHISHNGRSRSSAKRLQAAHQRGELVVVAGPGERGQAHVVCRCRSARRRPTPAGPGCRAPPSPAGAGAAPGVSVARRGRWSSSNRIRPLVVAQGCHPRVTESEPTCWGSCGVSIRRKTASAAVSSFVGHSQVPFVSTSDRQSVDRLRCAGSVQRQGPGDRVQAAGFSDAPMRSRRRSTVRCRFAVTDRRSSGRLWHRHGYGPRSGRPSRSAGVLVTVARASSSVQPRVRHQVPDRPVRRSSALPASTPSTVRTPVSSWTTSNPPIR